MDGNKTPLYSLAESGGGVPCSQMLLDTGANLEARDDKGEPVSIEAGGCLELTELFIESGTDVTAKSNDGQTALHIVQNSWYAFDFVFSVQSRSRCQFSDIGKTPLHMWPQGGLFQMEKPPSQSRRRGRSARRDDLRETAAHRAVSPWRK